MDKTFDDKKVIKIGYTFEHKKPPKEKEPEGSEHFVQLHNHSDASLLDGMSRIERGQLSLDLDMLGEDQLTLVRKAVMNKQPGVGLSDHGTLSGFFRFHTEAVNHNINPIIGIEWYLINNLKFVKESRYYNHMTMFAKNFEGLRSMFRANETAWTDGFYYRPRIDYNILGDLANGNTILLSGCGGDSPYLGILRDKTDWSVKKKRHEMIKLTKWFIDKFGDDFYFEIMPGDYEWQKVLNENVAELSDKYNVKLVATNDTHYLTKEDEDTHEVFLCIQSGDKMTNPNHWRFETKGLYVKTKKEMFRTFMKNHKYLGKNVILTALNNTMDIHKKVYIDIPERSKEDVLPAPKIPKRYHNDQKAYRRKLIRVGWEKRDINGQALKYAKKYDVTHNEAIKIYKDRIKKELKIIDKLQFTNYFLIVHELVNWVRKNGIILGPGRGSAAASLYCYLLGITSIDPMLYDLMFERFISEYKVTYPDIDMDFDWHRRDEIFQWMSERFGEKNFAHIGTYGILKGKQVIRDVSRVFDVPYPVVNQVTKYIIQRSGGDERKSMTVKDSFEEFDVMKDFAKQYPEVKKYAIRLESLTRNSGVHACLLGKVKIDAKDMYGVNYKVDIHRLYLEYAAFGSTTSKIKIRSHDQFSYIKPKRVMYTGIKHVYTVKTDHGSIVCTDDERFLTRDGYKMLTDLDLGDDVGKDNDPDVVWEKIVSIKTNGNRKTYDIEMDTNDDEERNFVANGYIVHNCGAIVSDQKLTDTVPIETRGSSGKRVRVTAVTGKEDEKLGLLKIDILGLKTLSIVHKAVRLTGEDIDLENIDLEDQNVLDEFTKINYTGIFQFDSLGMKSIADGYKFKSFEDVISFNALNRPGTMRSGITSLFKDRMTGKKKIPKVHPIYDRITKDTASCVIYQEQISKIFAEMAGYTLADSDQIRVAIAKSHGKNIIEQHRINFIEGCVEKGLKKSKAKKLFDQIVMFGCVSEKTELDVKMIKHVPRTTNEGEFTIRELYEHYDGHGYDLYTKSDLGGYSGYNKIESIVYTGKKKVYKIVTSHGKYAETTMEHKFDTPDGWKRLKHLNIDNLIIIELNGELIFDTIVSIKYIGIRNTYDVMMADPHNNFIINKGIKVHNSYGFNHAHAAAYSMISFWGMWLKKYYPLQFMAALLSEETDDRKVYNYINECKRLGIKVIHPDINLSRNEFAIKGSDTIIAGFSNIKGIGEKAAEAITSVQPFDGFYDFVEKVNRRTVNIRVFKALVLSGAMEEWCDNKKEMMDVIDKMLAAKTDSRQEFYENEMERWKETEHWSDEQEAKEVKSVFTLPSEVHPIEYYKEYIKRRFPEAYSKLIDIKDIDYTKRNFSFFVAGMIIDQKLNQIGDYDKGKPSDEDLEKRRMKLEPHGARYVNFDIEDSTGYTRFTARPMAYDMTKDVFDKGIGTIVLAKCRNWADVTITYIDDIIDLDYIKETKKVTMRSHKLMTTRFHPCHSKKRYIRKVKSTGKVDVIIKELKFVKTNRGLVAFIMLEDGELNSIDTIAFYSAVKGRVKDIVRYYKRKIPFVAMVVKSKDDKFGDFKYKLIKMSIGKR